MFDATVSLGRGVFSAPFLSSRAQPVLIAVDSQGRLIRMRTARADRLEGVRAELVAVLDLLDPQSRPQTLTAESA